MPTRSDSIIHVSENESPLQWKSIDKPTFRPGRTGNEIRNNPKGTWLMGKRAGGPCKLHLVSVPNVRLQKPLMYSGNCPLPKTMGLEATENESDFSGKPPDQKKLLRVTASRCLYSTVLYALLALEGAGSLSRDTLDDK